MLHKLIKWTSGKDIILYQKHSRQIEPLIFNKYNRKKFWFIEMGGIWKFIPFRSTNKIKFRIMYLILDLIHPKIILDINWITRNQKLYKVWTANNPNSKFVVLQHGSYAGGKVVDVAHKYTNCDIFLTWGDYFVNQFKDYNSGKNVRFLCFGNPLYNEFDRSRFSYKQSMSNKILLLPTALDDENILHFYELLKRLSNLKFHIEVKEHYMQGNLIRQNDKFIQYPILEGVDKITGKLSEILPINDYDFIISDHSTSLLDAIFFKNNVISSGYTTNYSKYLINLYNENLGDMDKNQMYDLVNIENQEKLISDMIFIGDNRLFGIWDW